MSRCQGCALCNFYACTSAPPAWKYRHASDKPILTAASDRLSSHSSIIFLKIQELPTQTQLDHLYVVVAHNYNFNEDRCIETGRSLRL